MAVVFDARTLAAIEAVQAGLELIRTRHGASDVREKAPGDLVTGTDLAIQDRIHSLLKQRLPNIAFVGEEGQVDLPSDETYWLVDPLCGTANYAAGLPLCAVNVGLVDRGEVRLAAVGDGSTGDIYAAEAGGGAWRLGDVGEEPLHVAATSRLISIDPRGANSGRLRTFGREFAARVGAMIDSNWDVRAFGTSLVLTYVASGRLAAAVYAQDGLPVHFCAGLLLAQEAGAVVTDQSGEGWTIHSPIYVAAATRSLHSELLELAQAAFSASA
jgi:myo-inositol-1(or 4)-monophosphatase